MPICNTCGLWVESSREELERQGRDIYFIDNLYSVQLVTEDNEHKIFYCDVQEKSFRDELAKKWVGRKTSVEPYYGRQDLLMDEHNCPYYMVKYSNYNIEWYRKKYYERKNPMNITISGGTFIQSVIGAQKVDVNNYIRELNLDKYESDEEKQLKQLLAKLASGIQASDELKEHEKIAAVFDLSRFSQELTKPPAKQDESVKNMFWGRLLETIKVSGALITITKAIGTMLGYNT